MAKGHVIIIGNKWYGGSAKVIVKKGVLLAKNVSLVDCTDGRSETIEKTKIGIKRKKERKEKKKSQKGITANEFN